jgi:hypothetical protein
MSFWSTDKPTAKFYLTDSDHKRITTAAGDWPKEVKDAVETPPPITVLGEVETPPKAGQKHWSLTAKNIPGIVQTGQQGQQILTTTVKDIEWEPYENGVKISQVSVESTSIDPLTGQYRLDNIFEVLAANREYQPVQIPLLLGDTNGDGELGGDDDLLYGLVDLRLYLNGSVDFTGGEVFDIANGTNKELPGLAFSTAPFTFDESTGFQGTPYTGSAYVTGEQDLRAVPEPNTLRLLSTALLIASAFFWVRLAFFR